MRTTVTLDPDVVRLLKDAAHATGTSFKVALNQSVRQAFQKSPATVKRKKAFAVKASPMGLRPGVDASRFHELAGDMEVVAFLATTKRLLKKTP